MLDGLDHKSCNLQNQGPNEILKTKEKKYSFALIISKLLHQMRLYGLKLYE